MEVWSCPNCGFVFEDWELLAYQCSVCKQEEHFNIETIDEEDDGE